MGVTPDLPSLSLPNKIDRLQVEKPANQALKTPHNRAQ
jgi:hypothetical protein